MLRKLFRTDIPEILLVEQAVHVVPWTRETFETCFHAGYTGWVIEIDQRIEGFIIVSLKANECHILNVCVTLEHQAKGYGRQMIEHALTYAKEQGTVIAYLEVRRSNSRAISLYKKMNFHLVGERKQYYPTVSGHEDALVFAKSLRETKLDSQTKT